MNNQNNPNTPIYWDTQFQKEYDLIKTVRQATGNSGYRWDSMRFGMVGSWVPFRGKLLDIGCGLGNFCRYMKARNPELEVYGVDFSKKAVELATQIEPRINYQYGTVYELPFPDDTFDVISCMEVLEHLDDVDGALKEWRRVLKKRGEIYITTPWKGVGKFEFGERFKGLSSWEHVFELSPQEFAKLINKYFKNVRIIFPAMMTDIITKKWTAPYWIMTVSEK